MIGEIISNEAREVKNPSLENFKSIKPEGKMTTTEVNDYWKSEFQNVAENTQKSPEATGVEDLRTDKFYTSFEDRVRNTNLDESEGGLRGKWDGERGNSTFKPSYNYMKETLKEYGVEGIDFVNGEADFSRVADATVKIDNMTSERYGRGNNFDQANTKLAEKFNEIQKDGRTDWSAEKVEDYRISNKMSWHERCDCKTMDLVPTKIHEYFKHSGGVAECKARDGIGGRFDE